MDYDEIVELLREARDLARTGLMPDNLGYTPEEWLQHKLNKISFILDKIVKAMEEENVR